MIRFITWRLVQFPLILAVIYLLTFLLAWVAPGTPFGNNERKLDPKVEAQLEAEFHAQSPWQFLAFYPWQMIRHGDLGPSMSYLGWSVNDVLRYSLPVSVTLGIFALTIALIFGCGIGVLAAVHRGGVFDFASLAIALIGISLPSFVAAGVLISIFVVYRKTTSLVKGCCTTDRKICTISLHIPIP